MLTDMKGILKYISVPLAALALTACLGDNYPGPDAALYGKAVDSETGEVILQDIGSEGSQIEMIELGYPTKTSRYLNFKTDGTYRENNMFKGQYSLKANRTNFVPLEETVMTISGPTEFDITTKPYCRIHAESIELVEDKQKVYARFSVERCTDDEVKEVGLFCDESPHVSYSINNSGDKSCRVSVGKKVSPDQVFTIKMPLTTLENDKDYWFRVGALTSVSEAKYNYAGAVQLHIVKKELPKKEIGIRWDLFDHFDYWEPHKTVESFVWDDKDFKSGSGSVSATSKDQGGPGYTQFITPGEEGSRIPSYDISSIPMEGAHMLLTLYVSDASHFEQSANGQIEIGSAGIFDQEEICWTFAQFDLRSGWQTLDLSLPEGNAMGSIRPKKLNWFRFYHLKETGPTTVKFDEIRFYYKTLVDACEDEAGWSGPGEVTVDEGDFMEGEGSMSVTSTGGSLSFARNYPKAYYAPAARADGFFRFWLFVSDGDAFNAKEGTVQVSSGGAADSNALVWKLPNVTTGWNLLEFKLSDAEAKGAINLKAVNYFRIYKPDISAGVTVKLDGMRYYKQGLAPEDEE